MKVLILRDFRAYRTFIILQLCIMILYASLNIVFGSTEGIIGFLAIYIPSFACVILFVGDKELISLYASLPVLRRDLVYGKYVSTYLISSVMLFLVVAITWLLSGFYYGAEMDLTLLLSLKGISFLILPITLIVSICYPFLFKYGISLGVKLLIGVFVLSYGIGMIIFEEVVGKWLNVDRRGIFVAFMALFNKGEEVLGVGCLYGIIAVSLALLLSISVFLSQKWMETKDLD